MSEHITYLDSDVPPIAVGATGGERVDQYLGERYGQSPESRSKYRDAIISCSSIEYLGMSIAEIARMHSVDAQCLRNQLQRHFPDVIPLRNKLRGLLGCRVYSKPGLHAAALERYSEAVQLLRETEMTVKETADRCGLSVCGLQQHLLFYHKDVAEQRLSRRIAVLDKDAVPLGGRNSNNRLSCPSAAIQQRYAPALEMLRTSDLRLTEVARRCHVDPRGLQSYVARWHRELMLSRRQKRAEEAAARAEAHTQKKESRSSVALRKYTPAVEMIRSGKSLSEAAAATGAEISNLSSWMRLHHPEVLEEAGLGMTRLASGQLVSRGTYRKYQPIAAYMEAHPGESTQAVAGRFGVSASSLLKVVLRVFPEIWKSHVEACSARSEETSRQYREKIREALAEHASGGATLEELAERCGVCVKTLSNWKGILKKEQTKHQDFSSKSLL